MKGSGISHYESGTPKVTVLMSVFNGERHLGQAIESILGQTFTDFEFLIINDGSTDSTRDIILSYDDPRICLVDNPENIGLTKSLNKGLAMASGSLIARQDVDDRSYPLRLEKQVNFFEKSPRIKLVGTQAEIIDFQGKLKPFISNCKGITENSIKLQFITSNPFIHSSVMFKKRPIWEEFKGYNEKFKKKQDFELWSRVFKKYAVGNLPDKLIEYRSHRESISASYSRQDAFSVFLLIVENISYIFPSNSPSSIKEIARCVILRNNPKYISSLAEIDRIIKAFDKIYSLFMDTNNDIKTDNFFRKCFSHELYRLALSCIKINRKCALKTYFKYLKQLLSLHYNNFHNSWHS
jgi:glycosyltransferase involved in cell wall biosynthesis